jgi:hypothetical protein
VLPPGPLASPKRTMVGMPTRQEGTRSSTETQGMKPELHGEAPPAPGPAKKLPPHRSTMLGVAMPGIAPLAPGVAKDDPLPFQPESGSPSAVDDQRPRVDPSLPEPVRPGPRGAAPEPPTSPLRHPAVLAIFAALLLALGAAAFALLWRSPAPLRAEPRVDAAGKDMLHVTCASCPDETSLRIEGATAIVRDKGADLPLATPLRVGENRFDFDIDRPTNGRDERVALAVQIAYRIRPDLSLLDADRPLLRVAVEATPGSNVTVDGKAIALGADGRGNYDLDVTSECTGPLDETAALEKNIPYAISVGGAAAERSTINVRVSVPPLHIDAPLPHLVVEGDRFLLAGRTAKGAGLSLGGHPIPVAADGTFSQLLANLGPGESDVVVRAALPGQASRLAHVKIKRVAHLSDEAREFSGTAAMTFAELATNISARVGEPIVLAGEVVEARSLNHQTIALLDVTKACPRPTCLARIVFGGDDMAKRGEHLQVFGHVRASIPSPGKDGAPVPEVTTDFALKGR